MINSFTLSENSYDSSPPLTTQGNNTQSAQIYYQQGTSLQQQGQFKKAIQSYQEAIALDPDLSVEVYSNLGCLLVAEGQLDQAILIFQTAITRFSDQDSHLYNNLAYSYLKQGNWDQAIANYLRAIKLQPDLVQAHYNLGKVFQKQGYHQAALNYFQRVLELKPNFTEVHGNCASSLIEEKQFEQALYHCQIVIEQKLSWIAAYCQKAESLQDLNPMDQAKIACSQFLKTLQTQPIDLTLAYRTLAQTYLYIGDCLAEYQNFSSAERYYQKANQIDQNWFEPYCRLGDCAVKYYSWVKASRFYAQGLKLEPQNLILHQRLETLLEKQQQIERGEVTSNESLISSSIRLPQHLTLKTSSKTSCQGLDCSPCLKQIAQELEPVKLSEGIHYFSPSSNPLPWIIPEPTVTMIPQGRAWIAPKKNWWAVCNAIAIINPQGELLTEFSRFYPTPLPNCQHSDWSQHQIFSLKELPPLKKLEGRVVVLSGLSGNVYFHWMVDVLPRLEILKQHNINLESIDWFVVNSKEAAFQRETLKKVGIPETKIIESDRDSYLQASHLIVPSFPAQVGWVVPWIIDFWRNLYASEQTNLNSEPRKRIYISRRGARYRQVLNELEVLTLLSEWGFVSVELEQLSVAEQVGLFAQAEVIIAPHGAGLTNLMFCQPNTCVIELISSNYIRHYYWLISRYLNLKHYTLEGETLDCAFLRDLMYPNPLLEDIRINLESLGKLLQVSGLIKEQEFDSNFLNPNITMLSSPPLEKTLEHWLNSAKKYFAHQQIELALKACESALKINPTCAEVYGILGNIKQLKGQFNQAQKLYEKAIELAPNYGEAYGNLGSLYANQEQWDLAIQYYQIGLQYKPESYLIYGNLAKVWTKLNRPTEATDCWYQAYQLQPEQVTAQDHLELGKALLEQGKVEEAIACFRNALNQEPNWEEAEMALKKAQQQKHNVKEEALSVTVSENQGFERLTDLNEAEILQQAEQALNHNFVKEAISKCRQVIQSSSNQPKAYDILGKALHQLGRLDLASRAYRKLVKLKPKDAVAYTNLGNLYAKQGQWKFAVFAYKRAIALNPNLAVAYRNLAQVFERFGQEDIAIQYWYQGFSLKPEAVKPTEHLVLGSLLLRRGRLLEAATCYQQAIRFDPACAEAYHNLGEVLATQGQWDEAIAHYQQALEINPNGFETYNSLGKALVVQGRWQEVLSCYHQALEVNPRLLMALQNLTQALIYSSDSLQESGNSTRILEMLAGAFLSKSARRKLPSREVEETWTTTAVSVSESLEESSQYQQAQARFKQGQYQDCIRDCEQLLVSYPQKVAIYWLLGNAWAALGNGEKAKHYYQQGIKLQPQQEQGYLWLGGLYAQEGNWKLAIACYQKAIQFQPKASTYRQLSQGWQALGNPENAEDCLYEALQLAPEQGSIQDYLDLGNRLWKRGQITQAMTCYQQVLERDPQQVIAHQRLAQGLHQNHQLEEAILHYRQAYKVVIQHQQILTSQSPLNANFSAIGESGWLAETQALLGDIYVQQQQWNEAIACYQEAVKLNPNLTSIQELLGDLWGERQDWEQAISCYRQVVKVEPKAWEVYHKLGDIFQKQGNLPEAIKAYRHATELARKLVS